VESDVNRGDVISPVSFGISVMLVSVVKMLDFAHAKLST